MPRPPTTLRRRHALGLLGLGLAVPPRTAAAATLSFATLYGPVTADGVALTPTAAALVGETVTITGFMAPPLKPEADFFVLTRYPMSTCPFCSSATDWPVDIVFVALSRTAEVVTPSYAIEVSGVLEAGMKVDKATGFVSLVRLTGSFWHQVGYQTARRPPT
ncbi:MAG: hypothetical protein NVS2B11_14280 [Acetobacteraceae bacterium]